MSTYCGAWSTITEFEIPAYVKSVLGVVSQTGQKTKAGKELTLMTALQEWVDEQNKISRFIVKTARGETSIIADTPEEAAKICFKEKHLQSIGTPVRLMPFTIEDVYNEAGISFSSLKKLGFVEKGDSMYGGPEIEVPSALLVSSSGNVSDQNANLYQKKLTPVLNYLRTNRTFEGCGVEGKFIDKIQVVIPPTVAARFFRNMENQGTYFTVGTIEDRNSPLPKEQLPPGKYDPNKPIYAKSIATAFHNDHQRPPVFDAGNALNEQTKQLFHKRWIKAFNNMQSTAQSQKGKIKDFFISKSNSPESKIKISSVSEPVIIPNPKPEKNCDFTVNIRFSCTYTIKEEFINDMRVKLDEYKDKALSTKPKKKLAPVQDEVVEKEEKPDFKYKPSGEAPKKIETKPVEIVETEPESKPATKPKPSVKMPTKFPTKVIRKF